jgi:hypothetical protein
LKENKKDTQVTLKENEDLDKKGRELEFIYNNFSLQEK